VTQQAIQARATVATQSFSVINYGSPQSTNQQMGIQSQVQQPPTAGLQSQASQQQATQSPAQQSTYSIASTTSQIQSMPVSTGVQIVKQGGTGNGISMFVQQSQTSFTPLDNTQSNAMTASYGFSNNPVSISARSEIVEQISVQQVQQEQSQVQQIALYQPVTKTQQTLESKPVEVAIQSTTVSAATNKSNPVTELLTPKTEIESTTEVKVETTTVKTNVIANELAGTVDTSMMTLKTPGFDKYTNTSLVDAPFYKTDSIYKNQFVVDNARAQRLLGRGSELKWQQMVDSQYKIGE
jgi:hypothetical protein